MSKKKRLNMLKIDSFVTSLNSEEMKNLKTMLLPTNDPNSVVVRTCVDDINLKA